MSETAMGVAVCGNCRHWHRDEVTGLAPAVQVWGFCSVGYPPEMRISTRATHDLTPACSAGEPSITKVPAP